LLEPEPVRQLLKAHRSGRHDNHKLLFSLVMFEQWLRASRIRRTEPEKSAGFEMAVSRLNGIRKGSANG